MITSLLCLAFPLLLIYAAWHDVSTMTIPNWVSITLAAVFVPAAFAAGLCKGIPSVTGISKGICWPVNPFGILGVYNQCAEVEWPGDDIE